MKVVEQRVNRVDGIDKVTGTAGTYTQDIQLPHMLYGAVLRSPYPHAKILSIDTDEAERLPGVRAVLTYKNTPRNLFNQSAFMVIAAPGSNIVLDQYIFDNVVRFVGDEVAAVAAETEELAREALKKIKVEYQELPAVFDPKEAIRDDAVSIHPHCPGKNLACPESFEEVGDFEKGWAECDVTYEGEVILPIQKHCPMETHGAVADVQRNGSITVYSTSQDPHPVKQIIARVFDYPESLIRVLNPKYIGGGFGGRSGLSGKAELIAVALSMQAMRPVKYCYDRKEDFLAAETRHSGYVQIRMGAMKDGSIHAMEVNSVINTGAYCSWGATVPYKTYAFPSAMMRIPNMRHHGKCVYTNVMPAGAFRGFGNPQGMFAMDQALSALAKKLDMDPIEFRIKNITRVGDPWTLNFPCESTELEECIRQATERIGWKEKRGVPQTGSIRRGVGIGIGRHISVSDEINGVYLRLETDGTVHIGTGMPDMGNGIATTIPQIFCEAFGVTMDHVFINIGDTEASPYDIGGHSTRCLFDRGRATLFGAKKLKKEVLEYAARSKGVPVEELDICDNRIVASSGESWPIDEITREANHCGKRFELVARSSTAGAVPWHAHAAEVEVDMETGVVRVLRVVAAHDVGVAINPDIVEGQIEGGVLSMIGYALREEVLFTGDGHPYHDSLHKYMLLTAQDMPEIEAVIVEAKDPNGPYGAKGIGESAVIPTAAAIADAVEDAIGIRFNQLPMTPERVRKAIVQKGC